MSETKHTPGPWTVGLHGAIVADCPQDCRHDEHEQFYGGHFICESVGGPDARLIAAAPELLEALKECRFQLDYFAGPHDDAANRAILQADTAIKKAEAQ